jgi:hypothetical protein
LKAELDFVEKGGHGRSVRTPWQPTSVFQDSLTCLNFASPQPTHPCSQCILISFVPPEFRSESVPCHYIPLNEAKETIAALEQRGDQQLLEETVKKWLRATIKKIEEGRQ